MKSLLIYSYKKLRADIALCQSNWFISFSNKFTFVLILVSLIFLIVIFKKLPPEVPLFFSLPWGFDRLAAPIMLFILPIGSLFWHGITILATAHKPEEFIIFAQFAYGLSLSIGILSFIMLIQISSLVL
jgi:hypothetical protein